MSGHINWKGEWISDESPFDKACEYSLKRDLIKELLEIIKKYQGIIKDKTIAEALISVIKKYNNELYINHRETEDKLKI